jgi:hypothetical protein
MGNGINNFTPLLARYPKNYSDFKKEYFLIRYGLYGGVSFFSVTVYDHHWSLAGIMDKSS